MNKEPEPGELPARNRPRSELFSSIVQWMTKPTKVRRLGAHPQRYERLRQIDAMDVETEYQAMYKLTSMLELPWEFRFGWNLAFYRSFAVPRMAELLAGTGEMEQRTMKRARDTADDVRAVRARPGPSSIAGGAPGLNRMHRQWDIDPDDYRYILTTFAVVPTRFADRYGWREVSAPERAATHRFYLELGTRMASERSPTVTPAWPPIWTPMRRSRCGPARRANG